MLYTSVPPSQVPIVYWPEEAGWNVYQTEVPQFAPAAMFGHVSEAANPVGSGSPASTVASTFELETSAPTASGVAAAKASLAGAAACAAAGPSSIRAAPVSAARVPLSPHRG